MGSGCLIIRFVGVGCKMTYLSYFKGALWVPAIILPPLLVADALLPPVITFGEWEQFFPMCVLTFGVAAYFVFVLWASRTVNRKTETEVARLVGWAPIIFMTFYGVSWILYGFIYLIGGKVAGFELMVCWLAFISCLLLVECFFSIVIIVVYLAVRKFFDEPCRTVQASAMHHEKRTGLSLLTLFMLRGGHELCAKS